MNILDHLTLVVLGSATGFEDIVYSPGWHYFQCPTMAEQFAVVADWREAPTLVPEGLIRE